MRSDQLETELTFREQSTSIGRIYNEFLTKECPRVRLFFCTLFLEVNIQRNTEKIGFKYGNNCKNGGFFCRTGLRFLWGP